MIRKYFWGAPIDKRGRTKAWAIITSENSDPADLDNRLNFYMNRVTDKTSGLLTMAGLVFAVSLFVMERKLGILVVAAASISMAGIILLAMNLGTVWSKDQANWNPHLVFLESSFLLFCRRVVRLQVALWLIAIAAVLSFLALLNAELHTPIIDQIYGFLVERVAQLASWRAKIA